LAVLALFCGEERNHTKEFAILFCK